MKLIKNRILFLSIQVFLLKICTGIPYGNPHHFIESPQLSKWGDWGKLEHCPSDQVVVGMKLKVHANQGVKDDMGLTGIKLFCQNPYSSPEYEGDVVGITSLVGDYGEWKTDFYCPAAPPGSAEKKLIAVGFQLRSESSSGVKDDTAGNNMKLVCSDLYQKQGYTYIVGDGTDRGSWTERQLCWPGYAVCGLQTQVETARSIDATGLNNIKVRCCRVESAYNFHLATSINSSNTDQYGSSSSSVESGESSTSNEKDHTDVHPHHRGDHATSIEQSAEARSDNLAPGQGYEEEQELTAIIDPEPTMHIEPEVANHESSVVPTSSHTLADVQSPASSSSNEHSSIPSEDENLPEEIAQIEQVDNSEAHNEDEENLSTATDSQQLEIPEDVVNALQDADSADVSSSAHDDHQHPHQYSDNQFHWGIGVPNDHSLELETNTIDEEEPQSSPRFGKTGQNATLSNQAGRTCNVGVSLVIGSIIMTLYLIKPF